MMELYTTTRNTKLDAIIEPLVDKVPTSILMNILYELLEWTKEERNERWTEVQDFILSHPNAIGHIYLNMGTNSGVYVKAEWL